MYDSYNLLPPLVPGRPFLRRLCTSIVWQAPTEQNGVIRGYQLRFSVDPDQILTLEPSVTFFLTDERHQEGVTVQVCEVA